MIILKYAQKPSSNRKCFLQKVKDMSPKSSIHLYIIKDQYTLNQSTLYFKIVAMVLTCKT